MMGGYFHAYLRNASIILGGYQHKEPFAQYLKNYFRQEKKFGSRDRKFVSDLCYGYLRLGQAVDKLSLEDSIIIGFFLTHESDNGFLDAIYPELANSFSTTMQHKINVVKGVFPEFDPHSIFAFSSELSKSIDNTEWNLKHLTKPAFFLRIRPGKREKVLQGLNNAGIAFEELNKDAIRLEKNIDLQHQVQIDRDCVVQDIGSQHTAMLLDHLPTSIHSFWDACAGSGGKSIMVHDKCKNAKIYASDIREEILDELRRRFSLAGMKAESIFCNDLSHPMAEQVIRSNLPTGGVDLIIADVPCTGSGTWRRTPEWLTGFEVASIETYSHLQKAILVKLISHLKQGGFLLYITCSVFEKENEQVVDYVLKQFPVKIVGQMHLFGEEHGGDHLFAALFTSAV
jgi:16S rRNA (cytosine967-C5)-methyltransferase